MDLTSSAVAAGLNVAPSSPGAQYDGMAVSTNFISVNSEFAIKNKTRIKLDNIRPQFDEATDLQKPPTAVNNKISLLMAYNGSDLEEYFDWLANGKRPATDSEYAHVYGLLTSKSLTRGQAPDPGNARWDGNVRENVFCHHVYFPAVRADLKAQKYLGAGFALVYSSFRPTLSELGHNAAWNLFTLTAAAGGSRVYVDLALIGGSVDSLRSLVTAINTVRPADYSHIYVVDCSTIKADDMITQINGASLGLAVAAAVLHAPQVLYTGYLRKLPGYGVVGDRKVNTGYPNYLRNKIPPPENQPGWEAVKTDDVIEDVQMIGPKMMFALANNVPLVIPHKTTFNSAMASVVDRLEKTTLRDRSPSMFVAKYAQLAYSTTEADQGYSYSSLMSPILLATTLPEAIMLGAIAHIGFYLLRGTVSEPRSIVGDLAQEALSTQFSSALMQIQRTRDENKAIAKAIRTDPDGYIANAKRDLEHQEEARREIAKAKLDAGARDRAERSNSALSKKKIAAVERQVKKSKRDEKTSGRNWAKIAGPQGGILNLGKGKTEAVSNMGEAIAKRRNMARVAKILDDRETRKAKKRGLSPATTIVLPSQSREASMEPVTGSAPTRNPDEEEAVGSLSTTVESPQRVIDAYMRIQPNLSKNKSEWAQAIVRMMDEAMTGKGDIRLISNELEKALVSLNNSKTLVKAAKSQETKDALVTVAEILRDMTNTVLGSKGNPISLEGSDAMRGIAGTLLTDAYNMIVQEKKS
jgi:hypothetical protein